MKKLFAILTVLVLTSCSSEPVRIGSKDLAESRILSEMFALLLEEDGVKVKRVSALGSTGVVFQALIDDDIDLYPEYTGTALAFMGSQRIDNADDAYAFVTEGLARNNLVMLERLGFETDYAVLTRPAVAAANGLETISDLAGADHRLTLGVMQSFAERPRDGLEPFLDRFGLTFEDVEVFPENQRNDLYDALVERQVDIVVGLTTDPEIVDYDLVALDDSTGFFPVYEAAPLTSEAALARSPEIAEVMAKLAGRIDDETMQALNAAVRLDGRPVARVARRALYDMGLVEKPPRELTPVLGIAIAPETMGTDPAIDTLRAVRQAMRGRDVNLVATDTPIDAMAADEARLALAPAVSGFTVLDGKIVRNDALEAVAAIGSTFLHALSLSDAPVSPADAAVIAAGPEGSASHMLATVMAMSGEGETTVLALDDESVETAAAALENGDAEVALVFATPGRQDLADLLGESQAITLVDADAWWQGSAQLYLPVMREAQISAETYDGINRPVATLSTQLILFGPAAPDRFVVGQQGPGAFFDEQRPLQDRNVEAINRNLGLHAAVDPYLRKAAALTPQVNIRDDRINPYPGRAILMIVILSYLVWVIWLFIRPERPGERD